MADRHREKPLSVRFGEAERLRLEDYAAAAGLPVRRVVLDAVRAWLDAHAAPPRFRQANPGWSEGSAP